MKKLIILFIAVLLPVVATAADTDSGSPPLTKKEQRRTLRGYKGFVEAGISAAGVFSISEANPYDGTYIGLDLLASYGFQFNNFFFLGIGTGISRFVNKSASAPLFVNARINMLNRHISPVLDCKTGAILGNINGLYFDFGLGVRIATQKKSAIYVLATFIGQCNTGTISAAKDLTNLRYGVKLGYEF